MLREPWFADIVNFLVTRKTLEEWSRQYKYKFYSQLKYFYWDDLYYGSTILTKSLGGVSPKEEHKSILLFCHDQACGDTSE